MTVPSINAGRSLRRLSDLPSPPGLPLLGNALQLRGPRLHLTMEDWARTYGPSYRFRIGPRDAMVVAGHDTVLEVLRARPDGFRRPAMVEKICDELGEPTGIFLSEGEKWKRQRRMIMHGFSPQAVKRYFPRLVQVSQRLRKRWEAAAREQRSVGLGDDLKRYTVDTLAGLAFGADINTVETSGENIQHHIDIVLDGMGRRQMSPFPYWRYLKLPQDRRLERSARAVSRATAEFIAQVKAEMASAPHLADTPATLLQAMLAVSTEPDSGLDDDDVVGNVATLLIAGEDTTASSLTWLVWLLVQNPDALQRARAEVLQHAPDPAAFSIEQMDALDYVEACAQEAMRLKPATPFIPLETLSDREVNGVLVPAGTLLFCLVRHDCMDDKLFPQAGRFLPERWLPGGDALRQAVLPFGAGARMCPGRYLSLLEIKVAIAMLLASFDVLEVSAAGRSTPEEMMSFVMTPSALQMRLRARS